MTAVAMLSSMTAMIIPAEETTTEDAAAADEFVQKYLAGKAEGKKIGLCMGDLGSEYIVSAADYFVRLMELAGAEVTEVNCDGNTSLQSDQVADFVNMGVDLIAIHANDGAGVAPAVQAAVDAGIPVVGFNKSVDGDNLDFAVFSSDQVNTGKLAAQWMADKAKELGVEDPKVAVIQGTMTASDAYLRQEGMEDVAKEAGLTLIDEPCDWLNDKSQAALSDVLTANPDLFGILTHSDCMGTGIVSALEQQGLAVDASDDNHIWYVSIDGDSTGVDCLRRGISDACVEQVPLALAVVCAKGCLDYTLQGKSLNGEIYTMDTNILTAADADSPDRWANYDPKNDPELWAGTEDIWNSFITE